MRYPVPDRPSDAAALASLLDHVFVVPEATATDVDAAAAVATELGCAALCVSPARLPVEAPIAVCAVVGFPSGAHGPEVKNAEAAYAVLSGAGEIEMVIDLGLVKAGAWTDLEDEIALVRGSCGPVLLKVVVESAALSDDELTQACEAAGRAGASYVVTSTGFHRAGGTTEHAVRVMRDAVGDELGVKASGGIRTAAQALSLLAAGANRLGTDAPAELLADFHPNAR